MVQKKTHTGEIHGTPRASDKGKGQVWIENLRQALEVIRTHRLRSGLLILGVAIGVTTVLAMVTVMSGLGKRIEQDIISANRPYLVVTRYDPMAGGGGDRRDLYRRKKLTVQDARAIEDSCLTIDKVDFQVSGGRMRILRYGAERTNLIQVLGASPNFAQMYNFQIEEGRLFTPFELEKRRRVVVLGYGPAKDLFPNRDPIGKSIKIGNIEYEVVGMLASREHFLGSIGDNFVIIPHTTFVKDHSERWDDYQIGITVKSEYSLEEGKEEITALLRARRKVPPGEENDFWVTTSETFRELISSATRYIGLVLVVISSIGLMVGGIGVMNIMLISVTERTREVGVRMAVGAKRSDIVQQFLIESATLTGIGGVLGIIMGLFVARGVANLIRFPYSVPIVWIFIAFLFSALIGIIFGIYPANRAAKMDPIKALHYE